MFNIKYSPCIFPVFSQLSRIWVSLLHQRLFNRMEHIFGSFIFRWNNCNVQLFSKCYFVFRLTRMRLFIIHRSIRNSPSEENLCGLHHISITTQFHDHHDYHVHVEIENDEDEDDDDYDYYFDDIVGGVCLSVKVITIAYNYFLSLLIIALMWQ